MSEYSQIGDLIDDLSEIDSEFVEIKCEEISEKAEEKQSKCFKLIDQLKEELEELQELCDTSKFNEQNHTRD